LRRDAAEGELHADHLDVGLALPVDALLEAELDELVFLRLAGEEFRRLGLEVVVLPLEDRDDVPGDVLEDLGVLERSTFGRHGHWLHLAKTSCPGRGPDRSGRRPRRRQRRY